VPGFDISSFAQFKPPVARCWLCLALWPIELATNVQRLICPGCNSYYVMHSSPTSSYRRTDVDLDAGLKIRFGDSPIVHAMELARLAERLRDISDENPPLRVLMKLLSTSRAFVHVASFNFDDFTLALLEMAAQTTSIAAIFAGIHSGTSNILNNVPSEAPDLECRVEEVRNDRHHEKLIIVDGLLAIIGSANLTRQAWRKVAANIEIIEVITDIERVAQLNNNRFSPLWKRAEPGSQTSYDIMDWKILTPEDPGYPASDGATVSD
jgi:phosphatidylserine/phosphatidylglycerophosphate/cardiolipin synthase-like enzyme